MASSVVLLLSSSLWSDKLGSSSVSFVTASVTTFLLSLVLYFYRELSQTFNKRPSHFVARSWLDSWAQPKVNAPLVEVKNNDYREALARGSTQVRHNLTDCEFRNLIF